MLRGQKNYIMKLFLLILILAAGSTTQAQKKVPMLFGKKKIVSTVVSKEAMLAACNVLANQMTFIPSHMRDFLLINTN
jgi:hypothetical protein